MTSTDRSWSGLEQFRVVLFAEDEAELARMTASAGTVLNCSGRSAWEDVLRLVSSAEVAALVVRAKDADTALARLDEATDAAPHLLRLVVVDSDAVPDVIAQQNRGLVEHVVPAPIEGGGIEWALRTALVRLSTAQSSKLLVEALRRDRAVARRRVDALESALDEANRRLDRIAPTDGTTGLYNRRHLMDHWRREVARARRYALPLAIALLQPQASDRAIIDADLRNAGTFLVQAIRDVDFVARAGDESFAVVLPHCGGADAAALAARLSQKFEAEHGFALHAGSASLRENGSDPSEVYGAAEAQLQEALDGA
ncbi:MAG: diguanylate cyclase [Proteobacteria bacterium]|nr:diguanylate cyclase [Pseudomonadota bacterium]